MPNAKHVIDRRPDKGTTVRQVHGAGQFPGVKESDLDISLTGNRLTISGRRQEEKSEEGEHFYAYERSYGSFSRSFTLPEGIETEHLTR